MMVLAKKLNRRESRVPQITKVLVNKCLDEREILKGWLDALTVLTPKRGQMQPRK